ncbi:MAG: erythromycin esterase family protein [Dysgonamonadaceae bacterium]|jgi:erythromycin esterase|nr:erythromycin esterase family protein [Dysgonamonadaceae bacterium]
MRWPLFLITNIYCSILFVLSAQENNYRGNVDPFKMFTPDFNQSIEENNRYQEWDIRGIFSGIFRKKLYKPELNDTLYYVCSGLERANGMTGYFHAQKRISLPDQSKQMTIRLQYEFCFYQEAELLVEIVFNDRTSLLQQNSFALPATFQIATKEDLPVTVKEFNLNIPAGANNAILRIKSEKKNGLVIVELNRCDILIDGNPLNSYTYNQTLPFSQDEVQQIRTHISDTLIVPDNVRLIGIGETVHGCRNFREQCSNIIRNQIMSGQVRFVGFEATFLDGYRINEYIHGRRDDIGKILSEAGGTFDNQANAALFRFMRQYNEQHDYPLTVMGFDIHNELLPREKYLAQFDSLFPDILRISRCMDKLRDFSNQNGLQNLFQNQIDTLLEILKEPDGQNNKLSLYESYYPVILSRYISRLNYNGVENAEFWRKRDSIMAENIATFFELLPENSKMIITCHLGHLSKKQQNEEDYARLTPVTGYYLSEKYKKQYFVLGLHAGTGSFFSRYYNGYDPVAIDKNYPFTAPLGKSLEQLCMEMNISSFYLNRLETIPLLDKIQYARSCGNRYDLLQFKPKNIQDEIDAIWFIRESQFNMN